MRQTYPDFIMILAIALLIIAILKIIIKKTEYRPRKAEDISGRAKPYTCGTDIDPENLKTSSDTFYSTFIKSFRLDRLKKLHSGHLTEYLYWMFAALITILTIMVLL